MLAHLPSPSKGMGYKSEDWWGVFSCASCHDLLDGRRRGTVAESDILRAVHETLQRQFARGNLKET